MQVSVVRPVFSLSKISKQITRAISVTNETVNTKEQTALKPWTEIPGPRYLPIVGTIPKFLPGGEFYTLDTIKVVRKLYNTYGPIVQWGTYIGKPATIFLYDAESVEQIYRGENEFPIRKGFESLVYYRKVHKQHKVPTKPTGLVSEHGELWKEFRSTVNPVLLQPKTIKLYTEALDEIAMEMIKRMKSQRDENNQIKDLAKDLNLWSLESIGIVALGCRINCFDPNIKEDSPVFQLIDVIQNIFKFVEELDFRPSLWRLFATPAFKKAMKIYEQQEILARYFIDKAVKEIERNPKPDSQKGVLEKLLDINKDFAYIMASDMLLAGVDTTSNSILGILYLLAKNTEKQNKLREELRTNPENKAYLKACIKEGIRMMPIALGSIRQTTKEYNILGYRIPKGCHVAFAHQEMSLMEKYFIRAGEYLPERWIAEKDDPLYHRNAHPFAYSPFGFGVRSCIGRRIAELEMETFIERAIENFDIEWFGPPPQQSCLSINFVVGPLNFIFKDAKVYSV